MTIEQFYQEAKRAKEEQEDDVEAAYYQIRLTRSSSSFGDADVDIERNPSSPSLFPFATLTAQNEREHQEDCLGFEHFKTAVPSTPLEAYAILSDVVKILARETHEHTSGSTLVVSLAYRDDKNITHVLTANVGDSRAMLCNPSEKSVTRLTCEHMLSRKHERNRLLAKNYTLQKISETETHILLGEKIIARQRTTKKGTHLYPPTGETGIAMTRTLGDSMCHHNSPVFCREPSFSLDSSNITQDTYLLTISDGLIVADKDIVSIFNPKQDLTYEEIAMLLAKKARENKSGDNLSVVITNLYNLLPDEMVLQFVADGHGGDQTSKFVKDNIRGIVEYVKAKKALHPDELRLRGLKEVLEQEESGKIKYQEAHAKIKEIIEAEQRTEPSDSNKPNEFNKREPSPTEFFKSALKPKKARTVDDDTSQKKSFQ